MSAVKTLLEKAKEVVGKATETVSGLIKKDEGDAETPTPAAPETDPSEHSRQMKAAVDAAREAQAED